MLLNLSKHDRICFLGDSITANGLWIAEIIEYFKSNYSELKTAFFNCGISGSKGREADIKNRLFCDCLNLFPKYLVIMFGMNDAMPYLYAPDCHEPDKEEKREKALKEYEQGLINVIKKCQKYGVVPIICTPTPYDEYTASKTENWYADIALRRCGDIVRGLASQYNILLIDMYSILYQYMDKAPVKEDRIHPDEFGQHLMAEQFLYSIGAKERIEPEKTVLLSTENEKRFRAEQIYRQIIFVERDYMLWQYENNTPSLGERKRLLKKRAETETAEWLDMIADTYFKYADFKDEIKGEIIRLTLEM